MTDNNVKAKAKYAKSGSILAVDACPEIVEWWDAEKNEGIDINTLTTGSKKKIHFKCPKCGEPIYRAMYSFLTKQDDGKYRVPVCQKCSPTVRKDRVYLTDAVPDIEKYWDYSLNEGKKPSDFSASASDKVWTKCPICGTSVRRNVRYTWALGDDGVGHVIHCRTCGKRNQGNSLVTLYPKIRDYWCFEKNDYPPEQYTVSSGKKVYVRCPECGCEKYVAICDAIQQDKDGNYRMSLCEDCAKTRVLKLRRQKDSNIAKACPEINLYWDNKNNCEPNERTIYTKSKIYTHCPTCRRLLYRTGANTFKEVNGIWYVKQCQKCATSSATHEKALSTRGPVISECPEIKDWWDYDKNSIIPDNLTRGSHYNAFLKCPACKADFKRSVHSFIATHRDGHLRPVACPECGYSSKGNPEDNLVKICPDIVNWWDYEANKPFVPEQFSRGSQYRAHLKCPDCGLELYTGIHSLLHVDDAGNVVISHTGRCRKYKAMESSNNLVASYPQIKLWWDYEKNAPDLPEEYTIFSSKRIHFKCPDCGAETFRRITDAFALNSDGSPSLLTCPYCSEKRPLSGYNTVKVKHPDLINAEWATAENILLGVDPDKLLENSTEKAWWKCPICKHHYLMSIKDRLMKAKRKHNPCTFCSGRRIPSPRIIL